MASNTENLDLLMKNPSTDGADTFNVQTMLNDNWQKIDNNAGTVAQTLANILKPTTPPIIGLPPSTTPDGMFQALGNTGELHVWRKTTVTPAGTTTTYPVSTNPNAYQEGSDAKPAGYTLGDVVTGIFRVNSVYHGTTILYANSVSVENNGVVTLVDESEYYLEAEEDSYNNAKNLAGKFIIAVCDHNYCRIPKGVVLFIPTNAVISFRQDVPGDEGYGIFFDRYQPVTGYAAIPAGNTIEYLGKLGDKARVQVVSYVGTGTYGESHKNSLTFNFSPRVLLIAMSGKYNGRIYTGILYPFSECGIYLAAGAGGGISELNCSKSNHEIFWWASNNNQNQLNISGYKYTTVAIG